MDKFIVVFPGKNALVVSERYCFSEEWVGRKRKEYVSYSLIFMICKHLIVLSTETFGTLSSDHVTILLDR